MQPSTQKIAIIIIIVLGAFFGILIFKNSPEPTYLPPSEPMITPVYLGSLFSAKMIVGSDLRVPAYLPPGYNFSQGSLFTSKLEKTQLTFQKGSDVIHIFQGKSIEPPPYFVQSGEPEPVSIAGNTGTWVPGTFRDKGMEKPFNQIQWSNGSYSYWIQSSLNKDEVIKIAVSLTPISEELSGKSPDLGRVGLEMKKKDASDLLAIYLVLFLMLIAGSSLFMFIINWEDWFFGIKLDGLPAGLYLFSKVVVASLLAFLLVKRESKRLLWSILSIVLFAIIFILPVFSSQRNMRSELGWTIFWAELVVLIVIPIILLIVSMIANGKYKEDVPDRL